MNDTVTTDESVARRVPHGGGHGKSRNLPIQWLRALAATSVVVYHAANYRAAGLTRYDGIVSIFDDRMGYFAVALFFAISGYLMAIAIRAQNPFVFLAHRIVRIYPAFLLVCAAFYGLSWLLKMPFPVDWDALSLAPTDWPAYPLGPEWTLVFEVSFYVALFVIGSVGAGKYISWIAFAWLVCLGASWHLGGSKLILPNVLRVSEDAAMAGGLLVPVLIKTRLPSWLFLVAGFGCFLPFYDLFPADNDVYRWMAGLSAVLIVTGAVKLSLRDPGVGDMRAGRSLARFGDYSYALYLCHNPLIHFLYAKTQGVAFGMLWLIAVAASIVLSIVLGGLDVWTYGHMKRAVNGAKPWGRTAGLVLFLALFFFMSGRVVYERHVMARVQALAPEIGSLLASKGNIITDVEANATQVGFLKSATLLGTVDKAAWADGCLSIEGWAVDSGKAVGPLALAFFQDGAFLGTSTTALVRGDISRHFHTRAPAGYGFKTMAACRPGSPVVVLAFNERKQFAVLANPQPSLTCR